LKYFKQEVTSKNPRDLLLQECEKTLEANEGYEWYLDPLIDKICSENDSLDKYIGSIKKSQYNSKIKALKPFLEKNPNIHRTKNNPTSYTWLEKIIKIIVREIQ
jgi:alpha-amylase/alpha-mannosidase (GH57 family)